MGSADHNSPAFKQQNGLLIVTFDEAATSDTSSCCGEIPGPAARSPETPDPAGAKSAPCCCRPASRPGTVSQLPYNHYSMLRSVEDMFGLPHLGYAQLPGETSFGSDVFNRRARPRPSSSSTGRPQSS